MRKPFFGLTLSAMLFALCMSAEAQQAGKVHQIGYLDVSTVVANKVLSEAFRQELGKLGWIEGKNITIEYRFADQHPARLPKLASELVRLKVDIIVCGTTPSVLAAKKATPTIPIVMLRAGNPVATGLVTSLARPGGNVTGLSSLGAPLATKRLEILKETVPRLTRVGVLWFAGGPGVSQKLALKEIRAAAQALEIKIEEIQIKLDPKGMEDTFQTAKKKLTSAVIPLASGPIFSARKRVIELANKFHLPVIYSDEEFIDAGGLMSYGADFADLNRRGAHYVDRILRGAKPADLPVEQPMKFEFIINLKAAKQIGLTIPPNVLARADRVIR